MSPGLSVFVKILLIIIIVKNDVYHLNILFIVLGCVSGAPMPQGSPWVTQTLVANLGGSCYYPRIDLANPNKI